MYRRSNGTMRPAAIAQKLEQLLRLVNETLTRTADVQRALNSQTAATAASPKVESARPDEAARRTGNRWYVKHGALLVQIVLALIAVAALFYNARTYNLSRSMGHKQLRAWITLYTVRLARDFSTTAPTAVDLSFKNTGQTPGLNMEWVYDPGLGFSGGTCARRVQAHIIVPISKGAIGPGEIASAAGIRIDPLPQACLDDLNNGSSTFSVRGTMKYEDIFGEQRFTNFCFYTTKFSISTLTACRDHNDLN